MGKRNRKRGEALEVFSENQGKGKRHRHGLNGSNNLQQNCASRKKFTGGLRGSPGPVPESGRWANRIETFRTGGRGGVRRLLQKAEKEQIRRNGKGGTGLRGGETLQSSEVLNTIRGLNKPPRKRKAARNRHLRIMLPSRREEDLFDNFECNKSDGEIINARAC